MQRNSTTSSLESMIVTRRSHRVPRVSLVQPTRSLFPFLRLYVFVPSPCYTISSHIHIDIYAHTFIPIIANFRLQQHLRMTVQHCTNTSSTMSSSKSTPNPNSLYPEVILTNPDSTSPFLSNPTSSSSSLYPAIDMAEVADNFFPDDDAVSSHTSEEVMVNIPGAMLHLIEKDNSVELACGDLSVVGLRQGSNIVAVLARIGDEIQWPLAKDEAAVKLDDSHYFFTLQVPNSPVNSAESGDDDGEIVSASPEQFEVLNYGLTIASKGQGGLLKELDRILETYSCFSTGTVAVGSVLDGAVARETTAEEMRSDEEKRERMRESSAAYWTTLAPNVEDYGGRVAKMIAAGTGQLVRGILWCGDVTVDRLKWGDEFLRKRMGATSCAEVCPRTLRRIKRFVSV